MQRSTSFFDFNQNTNSTFNDNEQTQQDKAVFGQIFPNLDLDFIQQNYKITTRKKGEEEK